MEYVIQLCTGNFGYFVYNLNHPGKFPNPASLNSDATVILVGQDLLAKDQTVLESLTVMVVEHVRLTKMEMQCAHVMRHSLEMHASDNVTMVKWR